MRSSRLLAAAFVVAACGGKSEGSGPASCPNPPPPPILTTASVVRLDSLDLGELDANGRPNGEGWKSLGFNLDGICTERDAPRTVACRRSSGADSRSPEDGPDGIDNAFGKRLVPSIGSPSGDLTGFSYLETHTDGRATLYVATEEGVRIIIPLVDARLTAPLADGTVTLAAIAPREALVKSVSDHIDLISSRLCGSAVVDTMVLTIRQSADILVSGPPDPDAECDGISVALRFVPVPAAAAPPVGPGCNGPPPSQPATDAGAASVDAGD